MKQRTSYIGLTNLAAAGPGRLSGFRGGSFRTPLSWSGGMSPTSPVRVQFLGTAFAIGSRSWRGASDHGGNREGAQSSFLLYSYGVLTVSCGTCLGVVFWLSVTELSLAQISGR